MKKEKEFEWIVKLLNSRYVSGGIFRRQIGGCKKDFEKEVGASENDKLLRDWIEGLILDKTLEFYERRNNADTYIINFPKLYDKLKLNPLFSLAKNIIDRDRVI